MTFQLPDLNFSSDALEPHIDAKTMEIHHGKHHATYISNLNGALADHPTLQDCDIADLCRNIQEVPDSILGAVRNNGGGHYNHSMFWESMSPSGGGVPGGNLAAAIDGAFGNFGGFQEAFSTAGKTRFGSGWAWLIAADGGAVEVCSTANQDNPLMPGFSDRVGKPLLGLDVWEHAYYLNYQNRRPDYIDAFWNVVDWDKVAQRFEEANS